MLQRLVLRLSHLAFLPFSSFVTRVSLLAFCYISFFVVYNLRVAIPFLVFDLTVSFAVLKYLSTFMLPFTEFNFLNLYIQAF